MIDLFSNEELNSLYQKNKKYKLLLLIVSSVGLIISVVLYLLTTRENQLVIKILLCVIVIIVLYFDCFAYFELYKNNKIQIKHFLQLATYDEVEIKNFTTVLTEEEYTKNQITFMILEVIINGKKGLYYIRKDYLNKCDILVCKKLFARGHYITKIEGGV